MLLLITVRDNAPDEIKGVYHKESDAYLAFGDLLREQFPGMTDEAVREAYMLGHEPWGNGFIALLDLSKAETANPSPERMALDTIRARIQGEYDHPGLVALGPLSEHSIVDILRIVSMCLLKNP